MSHPAAEYQLALPRDADEGQQVAQLASICMLESVVRFGTEGSSWPKTRPGAGRGGRARPRRAQRALAQMDLTCRHWAARARTCGLRPRRARGGPRPRLTRRRATRRGQRARGPVPGRRRVAPARTALRGEFRRARRRRRDITLSDLDLPLRSTAIPIHDVESVLGRLEFVEPLDRRISASSSASQAPPTSPRWATRPPDAERPERPPAACDRPCPPTSGGKLC